MKQPSILVVDDDPINYAVMEAILSDCGYDLHHATDGVQAIDALPAVQPDLILMDVMMPGISGIEACGRIKALPQWQAIPIVMVTALNAKEDLAECLAAGAEDFISKPVDPVELRARIHSMLRIKQQYDNIKALTQWQAGTIEVLRDNLDALRRNLVASLPHELNTPLHGISGVISVLLDQHDSMSGEEIRLFLGLAQQSVGRLEKFIQRFLVYFELEVASSGSKPPAANAAAAEPLHLYRFVEPFARKQAQAAGRAQDLLVLAEEADEAVANPKELRCIIEELLDNAFKFSPPGTPVTLACGRTGQNLWLSVHDYGKGMSEGQIAKIGAFMQFERRQSDHQGAGLGLAIVKKIIAMRGGEFSIMSHPQQETSVQVKLPCAILEIPK